MKLTALICFLASIEVALAQAGSCPFTGPNLIVNGDFEQGYYGFTSDFGRGVNNATLGNCATQGWILVAEIYPHISASCQIYPPDLSAMYGGPNTQTSSDPNHPSNTSVATTAICNSPLDDHTTGEGLFLTIDPDAVTGRAYWKQTISVCPNTNYVFSVWVRNISSIPAPYFHFEVGGVNINTPTNYPDQFWVKTAATWNSGNVSGDVQIELINDQPGCIENDVAIDDLFFGICGGAFLTCDSIYRFCSNAPPSSIVLSGSAYGISPVQYQWQKFNALTSMWVNIAGATDSVWAISSPSALDAGLYRVNAATSGNINSPNCGVYSDTARIEALPIYSIVENVNICDGETYKGLSVSGVYTESLQTIHGCDSIRILNLTVSPVISNDTTLSICAGEDHSGYKVSGIFTDTLLSFWGCDSIRTLYLTVNETNMTKKSLTICPGTSIFFNNQAISTTGIYRDTLTNMYGCDSIVELTLTVPPSDFLGYDTTICVGNAFTLVSPSENTTWFDNSVSKEKTIADSGDYWATITDTNGCKIIDTVSVRFNVKAYLPNVFSPNDDGYNDTFTPVFSESNMTAYYLQIYDRWGNQLFATKDPAQPWDGKFKGKACSPGVYVYFLTIETAFCQKSILKGDVSILK